MSSKARRLQVRDADDSIVRVAVSGPEPHMPGVLFGCADYHNPRVKRLRKKYGIDEAIKSETSELRQLMKLRHWVFSQWPIDNSQGFPYRCPFEILEHAKTGAGFHCAHASLVMHTVYAAFGFTSRILYIDANHRLNNGRSRHHGVTEVWSNDLAKWIVVDPKYDIHFERRGEILSATQLHEAVRKNGGKGIVKVKGLSRRKYRNDDPKCHGNVGSYYWVSYVMRSDVFTQPEWSYGGPTRLAVWGNEHWHADRWQRNSGPGGSLVEHLAYAVDAFVPIRNVHEVNWTPGVPAIALRQQKPGTLTTNLTSATPNFRSYLVRQGEGPWKPQPRRFTWRLEPGRNTLQVRTRNLFGVEGPVVSVAVTCK